MYKSPLGSMICLNFQKLASRKRKVYLSGVTPDPHPLHTGPLRVVIAHTTREMKELIWSDGMEGAGLIQRLRSF